MIYHDQVDGTTTFKDAIKAIKETTSLNLNPIYKLLS